MRYRPFSSMVGPLLALALFSTASCSVYPTVYGSGMVLTEERPVLESFHDVVVSGSADVELTQGAGAYLSIECDDNLLPHILTTVRDGVLRVRFESGSWSPSERPVYRIGMDELGSVRLSGSVRLRASSLEADDFALHLSGAGSALIDSLDARLADFTTSGSGSLKVGRLAANRFDVGISGSGRIAVDEGRIHEFSATTSGSGELHMPGVQVDRASLRLSGSGSAQVWVEEDLQARISGSGKVGFRGQPEDLSTSVSGSGRVYSL